MKEARVEEDVASGYRWVMLLLFSFINFFVNFCQFQPSFFAQDIMADFGVDQQGFTLMTSFPMMVGLFLAVAAGSISDKFGLHKTLFIALVVTAAGAVARAYCGSYPLLLMTSTILGVAATFCSANIAKVSMLWFPPKQVSLAVGIISAMGSGGLALAQAVTGILFDNYSTAFFWGGLMMAVICVLWGIFAKDRQLVPAAAVAPKNLDAPVEVGAGADDCVAEGCGAEGCSGEKKKGGLKSVLTSKGLWLAGLGGACYNGFVVTAGSLLITALVVSWGTEPAFAGLVASLFTLGIMAGGIVIPAWVVNVKRAKPICIMIPIVSMALVFLAWNIDIDAVRCILFPLAGFVFGAICPIVMTFPSILPEIGNENSGAAGGLLTSIMLLGSVCVPSLIVTPIAGDNYHLMIYIAGGIVLLAAITFALLPSVYSGKEK